MLKFVNSASTVLVTAAESIAAPLRAAMDRRKDLADLARLMDWDDHLLNDIGLTRDDIAAMLRQSGDGFSPASWPADPLRAASAPR